MKIEIIDHKGCFELYLEAETAAEASALARMTINHTRELRGVHAYASQNAVTASIVIGARKQRSNNIPTK